MVLETQGDVYRNEHLQDFICLIYEKELLDPSQ